MKSTTIQTVKKILLFLMIGGFLMGCSTFSSYTLDQPPAWKFYANLDNGKRVEMANARQGGYYAMKMEEFLKELPQQKKGGTVFLGDSITDQFPLNDAFEGENVINYGIGGDRVDGLRERLDICVKAVEPAQIYLMISTNDILWPLREKYPTYSDLAVSYKAMIHEIKHCAPKAKITVFPVLPFSQEFAVHNEEVKEVNQLIAEIIKEEELGFIDLRPAFTSELGELKSKLTVEGIHLNLDGYYAWLSVLLDREDYFRAVCHLSDKWNETHQSEIKVSKFNPEKTQNFPGGRGENELIVYSSAYGKQTGTNEWGKEAIVVDGRVLSFDDGNAEIPANGFVVSGHGTAAKWISANLQPNTPVEYVDGMIQLLSEDESCMFPAARKEYLIEKVYGAIYPVIEKHGKDSAKLSELKKILFDLLDLDLEQSDAMAKLDAFSTSISQID